MYRKRENKKALPCKVLNNMVIQLGEDNNCVNVIMHKSVRIPDDGKKYPLPPSLGMFPIHKVDDFVDTVPKKWLITGGIFFPMYNSEAMWMQFNNSGSSSKALKVGVGKVNAVNGENWKNELENNGYCVIPNQKWLDGIASSEGSVKQFVAAEMGEGLTVEHQVTGKEEFGGIQLLMYPQKSSSKERKNRIPEDILKPLPTNPNFPNIQPINIPNILPIILENDYPFLPPVKQPSHHPMVYQQKPRTKLNNFSRKKGGRRKMNESNSFLGRKSVAGTIHPESLICCDDQMVSARTSRINRKEKSKEIGLGVGGTMKQKVLKDPYGIDSWDQSRLGRIFIHIVNPKMYEEITGEKCPKNEITAKEYASHGYPWFDLYEEDSKKGIGGNQKLKNIKSIMEIKDQKNMWPKEDNETVKIENVVKIGVIKDTSIVRDGDW